ncbi:MAG TPA: imidazoleglycerol-phosphate dehydratase HisB [Acidimicrobiia bacterium]|nr:imidazoleglycerol-phosphate dehydratase HisB [Acidimicrobiia bacterium]
MTRIATCHRKTAETEVSVTLGLDGAGTAAVATGIGFFDHLLTALAHHGLFDLEINTAGDLDVDDHHTVEDTALVLGTAFADALGEREGIVRYGNATVPMDEALATAVVDVGGRPYAVIDVSFLADRIGALSTQMIPHALEAFARTAGFTLHVTASGRNDHHVAEATFKALARALRTAVSKDPRRSGIASTKGIPEERSS